VLSSFTGFDVTEVEGVGSAAARGLVPGRVGESRVTAALVTRNVSNVDRDRFAAGASPIIVACKNAADDADASYNDDIDNIALSIYII
jgi:hypothetical protein